MIQTIIQNWKSGITVSIVSIPLALALAITSGATPTQGIITAFWAGFIGALLGGSKFNIIGPTGALAGILVSYAFMHGYAALPIIAILSGIVILVAYFFNLDRYIIFIPRAVIHGFTLGVAFIIGLGQLDNALGISGLQKTERFIDNVITTLQNINQAHWGVFVIFITVTLFILFWNKRFPKIPGAAIAAFLGITVMLLFPHVGLFSSLSTIGDKYVDLHASLFENPFSQFDFRILINKEVWLLSIAVAVISILETLISGQIADTVTHSKFNHKKEMLGLSIANIGSGLMGGIPATAALARTALNIKSGATHQASAIISALTLGIISIFLINFFKLLPTVVIASILAVVAIGMVEKKHFIRLIENQKTAFLISLFVAIVVIVEDPIIGIIVGTIIALLIFVNKISYGQTEVLMWKNGKMQESLMKNEFLQKEVIDSDIIVYKISGTLTYINMPAHLEAAQKIKNNKHVIISLRHAFYADIDGVDYLGEIIEKLKANNNGQIILTGINKEIEKMIHKEAFYKKKLVEGKIYKRTSEVMNTLV
ncbi:TPA: hypothetical protein DEB00_01310 [Candidatus Uhrbacteria bacterium]|nr:hypothetical protein [Candidatus Uhrbacteria bacterium]